MDTLLVILAKKPVPGQVKTRFCPPLSPEAAAALYHCFLLDILEEMGRLPEVSLALAYSPPESLSFFQKVAPPGCRLAPQEGKDLGERLVQALAWGFSQGFTRVLIRNSDSPNLPGRLILEARAALGAKGAEVVLGPCPDGGYYLVGLTAPHPRLFEEMPWSTDLVLNATRDRARNLGLALHLLPPWPDMDNYEDLKDFMKKGPPAVDAPGRRTYIEVQKRVSPLD